MGVRVWGLGLGVGGWGYGEWGLGLGNKAGELGVRTIGCRLTATRLWPTVSETRYGISNSR